MKKKYNVICIKWGTFYGSDDVNKLCSAVKRNTSYDIDFYCFTENPNGLSKDIIVKPLPELNVKPEDNKFGYRKEAALCDDNLGGLNWQRVFFFDLDSLIVGNLDEFFDYPQGDLFYTINDWANRKGKKKNQVGQASCYSWVVGTLGYIKKYFEDHPQEMVKKYHTASQEYLAAKVIEKNGALNFWPDNWFKSFRFHCMRNWILRWLVPAKMPKVKGLKMIAFHGITGIEEAIEGVWSKHPDCSKHPKGIKKLYKHLKPTPWIKDYWI